MFIYEDRKNNRINVVLEGNLPVEEPDMILGVGTDGAITMVANGEVVTGAGIEDETAAEEETSTEETGTGETGTEEAGTEKSEAEETEEVAETVAEETSEAGDVQDVTE